MDLPRQKSVIHLAPQFPPSFLFVSCLNLILIIVHLFRIVGVTIGLILSGQRPELRLPKLQQEELIFSDEGEERSVFPPFFLSLPIHPSICLSFNFFPLGFFYSAVDPVSKDGRYLKVGTKKIELFSLPMPRLSSVLLPTHSSLFPFHFSLSLSHSIFLSLSFGISLLSCNRRSISHDGSRNVSQTVGGVVICIWK